MYVWHVSELCTAYSQHMTKEFSNGPLSITENWNFNKDYEKELQCTSEWNTWMKAERKSHLNAKKDSAESSQQDEKPQKWHIEKKVKDASKPSTSFDHSHLESHL